MSAPLPPVRAAQLHVESYIDARVSQIASLLEMVDNSKLVSGEVTKGPRTAAQRLPRHMRRRAMSYNKKRMPKRLRAFAASYINSKHRKKPPSRFARRRPRNLLLNYIRRQRSDVWLETHIWHAKRFHMVSRWGYKIPDRSFQRAYRPIYRASIRSCCVRDRSYLTCFLMSSPSQSSLISLLSPLCLSGTSPSFAFSSALSGCIEVSTLLYDPQPKLRVLIGPARFSWSKNGSIHQLSLWVHPSCREKVMSVLETLLSLEREKMEEIKMEVDGEEKFSSEEEWRSKKMRTDTELFRGKEGIRMECLRDQFNRFSLCGPNSSTVLRDALKLCTSEEAEGYREHHGEWISHCDSNQFMDGSMYTLLVEDFRLSRPFKRFFPKLEEEDSEDDDTDTVIPMRCTVRSNPSLWSRDVRLKCLSDRLSDSDMNKRKGETVGGMQESMAKIPIHVISRCGSSGRPRSLDGFDVIVPSGFGMDLWVSLQLRSCRSSGDRDLQSAHFESSHFAFPSDVPDSEAGRNEIKRLADEKVNKQLSRPYNRRVNFWKRLSVKYPFDFEWNQLCEDYGGSGGESFVLRDRRILLQLDNWLNGKGEEPEEIFNQYSDSLIPVQISMSSRGRPLRYALICQPSSSDLQLLRNRRKENPLVIEQRPRGEEEIMEEEEIPDIKEEEIVTQGRLFEDVVSLDPVAGEKIISLKEMFANDAVVDRAQKRKLLNRKKKDAVKRRKVEREDRLAVLNEEEAEKETVKYRESANRDIIGRIVRGDFSFHFSHGMGYGYVPIRAIRQLTSQGKSRMVLVRNNTSKYYHFGKLSILRTQLEL